MLSENLIRAHDRQLTLTEAINAYEAAMTGYAWDAVVQSRAQMDGRSAIHKAGVAGDATRAGMRTAMRLANHLPPVKRRMVMAESAFRGAR